MVNKASIAIAEGDGIGPEIMAATLRILEASGAALEFHKIEIGEKVYLRGINTGIEPHSWDVIRSSKGFLKAPITTPQGGGFKSLNVTIRTTLGLFANVRPCVSYHPFVETKHPGMDVVIVRENEEDLYVGIEYRQTHETYTALKIMTRPGASRIIRYAFEYAVANSRKKVTCFTKDNILKFSDGLFHKVFDEIGAEYPDIEKEHWIVDIGFAKLADNPSAFDVLVLPNLYGDILSDVAAQIAGSVGLAGSANIGQRCAMFEAIHGSALRRAGQNLANPSGLLLAAVLMLVHIGQIESAEYIHNAWLKTLEEGIHTYDIFKPKISKEKAGTKEFAEAVVKRLGRLPETLRPVRYTAPENLHRSSSVKPEKKQEKSIVGIDIFVDSKENVDQIHKLLSQFNDSEWKLTMISNRGVRAWPESSPEMLCGDIWRCRFMSPQKGSAVSNQQIASLLTRLAAANIDFGQTHNLCTFDGKPGYTLAQDEQ